MRPAAPADDRGRAAPDTPALLRPTASPRSSRRSRRRERRRGLFRRRKRRNRRMRWLRLLAIVVPLSFLALISLVFGMVLAVRAAARPADAQAADRSSSNGANSIVYASDGKTALGILTAKNDFFLPPQDIPPIMAHAIVAIEDKRFYTEPGIDFRGIARAFVADVFHTGGGVQGASTITEQFVKNALNDQKQPHDLQEAARGGARLPALAPVDEGARSSPSTSTPPTSAAAPTASRRPRGPTSATIRRRTSTSAGSTPNANDPASLCVTNLTADEAALLAAAVDAPSSFNGLQDARRARRTGATSCCGRWPQQGYLTAAEALRRRAGLAAAAASTSRPPSEEATDPSAGYFTSWVADQLVNHLGYGPQGRRSTPAATASSRPSTPSLQSAAQQTVDHILPPGIGGPAAALVAIDNTTGEVRAMVGGYNYNKNPFNLATAGRAPARLRVEGVRPRRRARERLHSYDSPVLSKGPWLYPQQPGAPDVRAVRGPQRRGRLLQREDPAVGGARGLRQQRLRPRRPGGHIGGTPKIANIAHQFGITTTISLNPSMVIGGLNVGVTPLDMAHAYETIANGGRLTTGTLASYTCAGGDTPNYTLPELRPPAKTLPGPGRDQDDLAAASPTARHDPQTTRSRRRSPATATPTTRPRSA